MPPCGASPPPARESLPADREGDSSPQHIAVDRKGGAMLRALVPAGSVYTRSPPPRLLWRSPRRFAARRSAIEIGGLGRDGAGIFQAAGPSLMVASPWPPATSTRNGRSRAITPATEMLELGDMARRAGDERAALLARLARGIGQVIGTCARRGLICRDMALALKSELIAEASAPNPSSQADVAGRSAVRNAAA